MEIPQRRHQYQRHRHLWRGVRRAQYKHAQRLHPVPVLHGGRRTVGPVVPDHARPRRLCSGRHRPDHPGNALRQPHHGGVPLAFMPTGSGLAFAWNDTVTDSNGTHDQVEFAHLQPRHAGVAVGVPDRRRQCAEGPGLLDEISGVNVDILAYGDDTGTHVVEFDAQRQSDRILVRSVDQMSTS